MVSDGTEPSTNAEFCMRSEIILSWEPSLKGWEVATELERLRRSGAKPPDGRDMVAGIEGSGI